jgi:Xaa-Pro aminopeptidase
MSMGEKWTELTVSNQLDQRRREQDLNQGISFKSIVGFGPHGALPHYEPNNITAIQVDNSSLLVIDSGGHYKGRKEIV